MGHLRWIRLDTGFPHNPKILQLAYANQHRAIAVYVCGLAYAGEQTSDGFIPKHALNLLFGRQSDAKRLTEVGLWIADENGWLIHDWLDYQLSAEQLASRTKQARMAAHTRWYGSPDMD